MYANLLKHFSVVLMLMFFADYSLLGSDIGIAASSMGTFRRGTPDETSNSHTTLVIDQFVETRLSQVSLGYPAPDSKLSRAGLCEYTFPCLGCNLGLIEYAKESLVYLLDEALDLWSSIIMQTPAPASPEILSLLPALFPIFEAATDSVPQALQIAESYIILAPQEVLSDRVRLPMLASFETLLKSTTRQRLGTVPRLVELMIR